MPEFYRNKSISKFFIDFFKYNKESIPTAGLEPATIMEQILSLSCLPISPSGFPITKEVQKMWEFFASFF